MKPAGVHTSHTRPPRRIRHQPHVLPHHHVPLGPSPFFSQWTQFKLNPSGTRTMSYNEIEAAMLHESLPMTVVELVLDMASPTHLRKTLPHPNEICNCSLPNSLFSCCMLPRSPRFSMHFPNLSVPPFPPSLTSPALQVLLS